MGISNGLNRKTAVAMVAVLIIVIGAVYYFGGYNYGSPANTVSPSSAAQGSNQVSINNFAFSPAVLNVSAGTTVVWINNDSAAHRISGNGFQSGDLAKGQSYSFTFTSVGTFDYICSIHPSMKGAIIVK